MLHKKEPREQDGRDSLSRYRAQIRSAAMASLSILEEQDIDRVYCDLHDDFVIRKKDASGISYIFYQVKTKNKQNHNWSLNDLFGLNSKLKDQNKQDAQKIKDSFVGKLLLHTVVFEEHCNAVVFQTNINNSDSVEELFDDIRSGNYENKFTKVLLDKFCECFPEAAESDLSEKQIQEKLSKLKFEVDVQYLKSGDNNFEPLARDKIYKFSEVDLEYSESREILIKILELVQNKSSGVISELTSDSIEIFAGISIDDLLPILSISKDAYYNLLKSGDSKAIKSASIIQRTLSKAGADDQDVEYCSRCKINWDLWLRKNRHVLPEFELQIIDSRIRKLLRNSIKNGSSLNYEELYLPIKEFEKKLEEEGLLYDLNVDLILGGVFAELVKGKS